MTPDKTLGLPHHQPSDRRTNPKGKNSGNHSSATHTMNSLRRATHTLAADQHTIDIPDLQRLKRCPQEAYIQTHHMTPKLHSMAKEEPRKELGTTRQINTL